MHFETQCICSKAAIDENLAT